MGMAPRFLTILTGRNLSKIQQSSEAEPSSTINEKAMTFTRVIEDGKPRSAGTKRPDGNIFSPEAMLWGNPRHSCVYADGGMIGG